MRERERSLFRVALCGICGGSSVCEGEGERARSANDPSSEPVLRVPLVESVRERER